MKIKGLRTVIYQVSDMDRSVAFYNRVLGLELEMATPHWSSLVCGDVRIGLHPPFTGQTAPYGGGGKGWLLNFEVNDIENAREALAKAGIKMSKELHEIPGGVVLDLEDPDGNNIQLVQMNHEGL